MSVVVVALLHALILSVMVIFLTKISFVISHVKNIWNCSIFTYEIFISRMKLDGLHV